MQHQQHDVEYAISRKRSDTRPISGEGRALDLETAGVCPASSRCPSVELVASQRFPIGVIDMPDKGTWERGGKISTVLYTTMPVIRTLTLSKDDTKALYVLHWYLVFPSLAEDNKGTKLSRIIGETLAAQIPSFLYLSDQTCYGRQLNCVCFCVQPS
jgi:hypothetical protein